MACLKIKSPVRWTSSKKNTYDLLGQYTVPVPPYPVDRIWANVGQFKVTGFEAFVQVYPVRNKNFDWKTSFVFSTYKQEVVSLGNDEFNWSAQREGWLEGRGLVGDLNWTQIIEPGKALGTWFMPEYAGLSADGKFLFYTASGGVTRNLADAERRVVAVLSLILNWDGPTTSLSSKTGT